MRDPGAELELAQAVGRHGRPSYVSSARWNPIRCSPAAARIAGQVRLAKRIGYTALLAAIVAFAVAIATSFSGVAVAVAVVGLAVAFVVLPIPIVLGYGVRAAEREERGGGSFH